MRKVLGILALVALCLGLWAFTWSGGGGTGSSSAVNPPLIDCSGGFGTASSGHNAGNCGIMFSSSEFIPVGAFEQVGANNGAVPGMSGTAANLVPSGSLHVAMTLMYQPVQLSVQKFNTTMTWVANDWNVALIWNNTTNQGGGGMGASFAGGAGCEGDFFQGFSVATPPDNVFAVQFDSTQWIKEADSAFTYSSVGVFQSNVAGWSNPYIQCPCVPMSQCGTNNTPTALTTQKVSTSPVPLNSPATTAQTTTGHTYSANLGYDGTTLTVTLADLTVGGSVTKTWAVNIPTSVGQNKAWFGVGASTNAASAAPLLINSLTYSVPSPL